MVMSDPSFTPFSALPPSPEKGGAGIPRLSRLLSTNKEPSEPPRENRHSCHPGNTGFRSWYWDGEGEKGGYMFSTVSFAHLQPPLCPTS